MVKLNVLSNICESLLKHKKDKYKCIKQDVRVLI